MKENFIIEQTLKPSWYGTAFDVKIKSAGYVAKQRNTVTVNGEWLANTTMQKALAEAAPGAPQ